jgi:hypothetical protein
MEGGRTVGENGGGVEENFRMRIKRRYWGLRPWKRHSTILMVAGIIYTLIGFAYFSASPNKTRDSTLVVVLQIAPIQFWGGVFCLAGLLTLVSSRWPPFAETWGYMVLTGLSAGWAATYLMGTLFFHAPIVGVTGGLLWSLLAFMWWAISGLLNPDKTAVATNGRH